MAQYEATPSKRSRFGKWSDENDATSASLDIVDEIDLYLKVGKSTDDDPAHLLSWWSEKSSTFRLLAQLARRVLAIPATSASSERTWSRVGLILSEKRTKLSPQKVCDLLVIHNYFLVSVSILEKVTLSKNWAPVKCKSKVLGFRKARSVIFQTPIFIAP